MKTALALLAALSISACQNATPKQEQAATAAGVAALTTVATAYSNGQKVDSQVAAQAAAAALAAGGAVLSTPTGK